MSLVFVIGLFASEQQKFDAECKRHGLRNQSVYAKPGKQGLLQLHPFKNDVPRVLNLYLEKIEHDYSKAHVIVLPYASYPEELDGDLEAIKDLGGTVIWGINGQDGWPSINPKQKIDKPLADTVFARLWQAMPPSSVPANPTVSEYFQQVADANSQILFHDDVFKTCDGVAPLRREFLRRAIDALVEFASDGSDGRIDAFFRKRQLTHAQSGGVTTTIEIYVGGKHINSLSATTHLKQGDKTTPEGAARLYYQQFALYQTTYVAVVYAGKHPESDIKWTLRFPEQENGNKI